MRRVFGVRAAFDLLGRYGGDTSFTLTPKRFLRLWSGTRQPGCSVVAEIDLVALAPVDRGDAQVHAVGGVLGEGHVVGTGPDKTRRGLAGPGVRSAWRAKRPTPSR